MISPITIIWRYFQAYVARLGKIRHRRICLDWGLYRVELHTSDQNRTSWGHLALSIMGENVFPNAAVDMMSPQMVMVYNY